MSAVADLLEKVAAVAKLLRASDSAQVKVGGIKSQLHDMATFYFANVHDIAAATPSGSSSLDAIFQELHAASRKSASRAKCLELLKSARKGLVECEGLAMSQPRETVSTYATAADTLIVASLADICPSASLAYRQALLDFEQQERLSWRGPATDLREALRETLDVLAPDKEVEGSPGFKLEPEAKHPTMKQKVRFILKTRGVASGAMAPPENAVSGVEEIVGGLTRSVYNRSSVSTHTATNRAEVVRVHAWVRLVLCELLELPA
jgi:hypothetical protein